MKLYECTLYEKMWGYVGYERQYWGYGEESTGKHQAAGDAEHVRATEQQEPEAGIQGR